MSKQDKLLLEQKMRIVEEYRRRKRENLLKSTKTIKRYNL
jgi:hypothetical protein